MNRSLCRLCLFCVIFLGSLGPLVAQALQNRTDPDQQALVRNDLLAGRLPEVDTWPQPAAVPGSPRTPAASSSSEPAFTDGLDVLVSLSAAGQVNGQDFWNQYLFNPGVDNSLARLTLHGETLGQWGFLMHADFYGDSTGFQNTSLVWPNSTSVVPLEHHWLTQSWLWFEAKPFEVQIGRGPVHIGPMDNSLILSDAIPFMDMIRGSVSGGHWRWDWMVSTPETRLDGGNTPVEFTLIYNLHRVEYKSDTWQFDISEYNLVVPPLVLADFFPVTSTHQTDMAPNHNALVLGGQWVPAPGFRLMGQYGLNALDSRIFGIPNNPVPTIWAFILGAEWQGSTNDGPLRLYSEIGMTHYLWGNYGDSEMKAIYYQVLDGYTASMPLTSPYGPGTAWVNLSSRWSKGPLSIQVKLEVFDTKDGVSFSTPYVYNWALEGLGSSADERLSVKVRWAFNEDWSVEFEPAQMYNDGQFSGQGKIVLNWGHV